EGLATEGSYESRELGQVCRRLWIEPSLDRIGDEGRHQCRDHFGLIGPVYRFDRQRPHARNPNPGRAGARLRKTWPRRRKTATGQDHGPPILSSPEQSITPVEPARAIPIVAKHA